jgi:hypothetical protein
LVEDVLDLCLLLDDMVWLCFAKEFKVAVDTLDSEKEVKDILIMLRPQRHIKSLLFLQYDHINNGFECHTQTISQLHIKAVQNVTLNCFDKVIDDTFNLF